MVVELSLMGILCSYMVFCYDPSEDKWTTLPPLTVRCFGLGQLDGELVAVGGVKKRDSEVTREVYTYDERQQKWKQMQIPSMPTARASPGVLSLQSALVVVGGIVKYGNTSFTAAVDLYKSDMMQWYMTDPLPLACQYATLVFINDKCYVLGGSDGSRLNQALCASVDDLLGDAVP